MITGFNNVKHGLYRFNFEPEMCFFGDGWPFHREQIGDMKCSRFVFNGDIVVVLDCVADAIFWRVQVLTSQGIGWLLLKKVHAFVIEPLFISL